MKLESFPYIQAIQINDCYAIKDTHIQVFEEGEAFRHLILTGKNGSGKTTVLDGIAEHIKEYRLGQNPNEEKDLGMYEIYQERIDPLRISIRNKINSLKINLSSNSSGLDSEFIASQLTNYYLYQYFDAQRTFSAIDVPSPIPESEILKGVTKDKKYTIYFKHFLVNKALKRLQYMAANKEKEAEEIGVFLNDLQEIFRTIFEDKLELSFLFDKYDFVITLSDDRIVPFDRLPSGISSLLEIVGDLIMQHDLARNSSTDGSIDFPGIVLIDEPENHAHLAMQEQILPLLTTLFPRVQFIVATHSPAIIASIPNATVFDLSSKQTFREGLVGSSYSQLMITLFGLRNQYSTLADTLIDEINALLSEKDKDKAQKGLKKVLEEKEELLSPSILLEINAAILQIQKAK